MPTPKRRGAVATVETKPEPAQRRVARVATPSPNGKGSNGKGPKTKTTAVTVRKQRLGKDEPGTCVKGNDPADCTEGNPYVYQKWSCRGLSCRRAVSEYYADRRAQKLAAEAKEAARLKRATTRAAKAGGPPPAPAKPAKPKAAKKPPARSVRKPVVTRERVQRHLSPVSA